MGREAIARYRRWIDSLPAFERDKPYLKIDGRYLSPLEVLHAMEAGTELGRKLQTAEDRLMRRPG